VYLLPPLAFVGGVYLLVRAIRAWRSPGSSSAPPAPPSPSEDIYVEQLERELRERT
jgi:threonine/homoserine/homoserine lactone efflux protein